MLVNFVGCIMANSEDAPTDKQIDWSSYLSHLVNLANRDWEALRTSSLHLVVPVSKGVKGFEELIGKLIDGADLRLSDKRVVVNHTIASIEARSRLKGEAADALDVDRALVALGAPEFFGGDTYDSIGNAELLAVAGVLKLWLLDVFEECLRRLPPDDYKQILEVGISKLYVDLLGCEPQEMSRRVSAIAIEQKYFGGEIEETIKVVEAALRPVQVASPTVFSEGLPNLEISIEKHLDLSNIASDLRETRLRFAWMKLQHLAR